MKRTITILMLVIMVLISTSNIFATGVSFCGPTNQNIIRTFPPIRTSPPIHTTYTIPTKTPLITTATATPKITNIATATPKITNIATATPKITNIASTTPISKLPKTDESTSYISFLGLLIVIVGIALGLRSRHGNRL
jgi:LPXTG-motif cell wall-anchored protein